MTPEQPTRGEAHSRPVYVSNVQVLRGTGYIDIQFDVAWEDSWRWSSPPAGRRRAANWDAAWLFIKYQLTTTQVLPGADDLIGQLDSGVGKPMIDRLAALEGRLVAKTRSEDKIEVTTLQRGRWWRVRRERSLRGATVDQFNVCATGEAGSQSLVVTSPGPWAHAKVLSVDAVPPGAVIDLPEDGAGVFLYRATDGEGPVRFPGVKLRMVDTDTSLRGEVDVWVLGLEMVHVPEGPFSLGDPQGPDGPLCCLFDSAKPESDPDRTYHVDSEETEIVVGPGSVEGTDKVLYYDNQYAFANPGDQSGPIPAAFPKGFSGFYIMKHQITQGDYNDFINTLTGAAWINRTSYWYGSYRYTIFKTPNSQRFVLRPLRAMNWLNWMDGTAYAAWSGLRPMTELEYEKACRGTDPAKSGEYAWGTTALVQAQVIIGDEADGTEAVSGNCNVGNIETPFIGGDGGLGPVRDDAFAAPGRPHTQEMFPAGLGRFTLGGNFPPLPVDVRESTGVSYYGAYGLSGNVWELCVTIGDPVGRAFTGTHGDGTLDSFGNPDCRALGWPGADVIGMGGRGGSWYTAPSEARIADRTMGSGLQYYTTRSHDFGFRCVRTAPKSAG